MLFRPSFLCKSLKSDYSLQFKRWMGLVTRQWERKRFYRHVTVHREDSGKGWGVKLDHRNLRTPLKQIFLVPSEGLAQAVAGEWQAQQEIVRPSLMHVTSLINTVLDECDRRPREEVVRELLGYMDSDTLCFRASEPDELVEMQTKEWSPLIQWFNQRFECELTSSDSILPSPSPSPQADASGPRRLVEFMESLDQWAFAGFQLCVDSCKSLVLSCALYEGLVTTELASDLARLETRFQTRRWGEVEWHHHVEETDLKARLAAANTLRLLAKQTKL